MAEGYPRCGGWRPAAAAPYCELLRLPHNLRPMRLDPTTHAFVYATGFLTSLTFAIFAMHLIALILERVLA